MNSKKIITIVVVLAVIFTIIGGTLAYWSWVSDNSQKTNVTFTIGSNFSCGADGGGNITNTNYFVPTDCMNSTYAIKREITTSITNNGSEPVYMDMWLNIDSIGTGLTMTTRFLYSLTTDSTSCTNNIITIGSFNGKIEGDRIILLDDVDSGGTYYLYIWLDSSETSASTQNQSVSLSLGGECTNHTPYVYTTNIYDEQEPSHGSIRLLYPPIGDDIIMYNTPGEAIAALETAYSAANNNEIASIPIFLRHKVKNDSLWCMSADGECEFGPFYTELACQNFLHDAVQNDGAIDNGDGTITYEGNVYSCVNETTITALESYVGFVISSEMAANNSDMTAGTYYLQGDTGGTSYNANKAILISAFGSTNCSENGSNFHCNASSFRATINTDDNVNVSAYSAYGDRLAGFCRVEVSNYVDYSYCEVADGK